LILTRYRSAWSALIVNIQKFSILHTLVFFGAILVAIAADLVGNGIIAGTGVALAPSRNISVTNVPFAQAGYVGGSSAMFETDDQLAYIFTSASYYPRSYRTLRD